MTKDELRELAKQTFGLVEPQDTSEVVEETFATATLEDGTKITGKMFVDASYEGDLMAQAGVSYSIGREPNSRYGEDGNGNTGPSRANQLRRGIDPYIEKYPLSIMTIKSLEDLGYLVDVTQADPFQIPDSSIKSRKIYSYNTHFLLKDII